MMSIEDNIKRIADALERIAGNYGTIRGEAISLKPLEHGLSIAQAAAAGVLDPNPVEVQTDPVTGQILAGVEEKPKRTRRTKAEMEAARAAEAAQASGSIEVVQRAEVPVAQPAPQTTVPPATIQPVEVLPQTPPVAAFPPGFFTVPLPEPAPVCPFNDPATLQQYLVKKFHELGPVHGMRLQESLKKVGAAGVNDVPQARYAELFADIESIKVA